MGWLDRVGGGAVIARRRNLVNLALGSALLASTTTARATSEMLFGFGPRSAAVAQADVADPPASAAAYANPALAWRPGTRIAIGYGHGFTTLRLNGADAHVRDIAGTDIAMQVGGELGAGWSIGGGLVLHVPNRSLARIAFAPGSEPVFTRFDPSPQRTTADVAVGIRQGILSVGFGASAMVAAEGEVNFLLGQDGNGAYADGEADISLPYRLAPTAGVALDLGPAALGVRARGAQSLGLDLGTQAEVQVQGNPLNGTTRVLVAGSSGYVPATFDFGARLDVASGWRVMSTIQLARWSRAPSPAADLTMQVDLGLTPGQLEGRFIRPAYRDTLSPRLGFDAEPGFAGRRLALRAGYAFSPSPVPAQAGFATHADASFHTLALGAGWDFDRVWGVALRVDVASQLLWLRERRFDKPLEVLPFAHYGVGGRVLFTSAALEGTWQ